MKVLVDTRVWSMALPRRDSPGPGRSFHCGQYAKEGELLAAVDTSQFESTARVPAGHPRSPTDPGARANRLLKRGDEENLGMSRLEIKNAQPTWRS